MSLHMICVYNFPMEVSIMKKLPYFFLLISLMIVSFGGQTMSQDDNPRTIKLPEPVKQSDMSIEECLAARRSVREYGDRALSVDEVSQLLWAAQGITADWGARTAPSAGGLFPIRLFVAVRDVDGIDPGSWEYLPREHSVRLVKPGDITADLCAAALDQECVAHGQIVLIISAIPSITEAKYGDRSMRYIDTEVGAVCENIYLQCEALDLGTVSVGAFYDDEIAEIVGTDNAVRLIMPVGPNR